MSQDVGFSPQLAGNEWKPRSNEVAVRLYDRDLTGSSFIVPPTQTGTLVVDGKIQGRTVGKQDLKNFWQRYIPLLTKKTNTQLFLARNGLLSLSAIIGDAKSSDGHVFHVLCNYQVEIQNFDSFCHHFFQAKDVATTNDLEGELRPFVAAAVTEFISNASSSELVAASSELLQRFVDEIETRLKLIAARLGLQVTHVMVPAYSSKSFQDLVEKKKRREMELEESRESQEYQRQKLEIDKDAYDLEKDIRDLEFDKVVDEVDYAARLEARKNEIKSKQLAQRLQVQQGIDRAFQEFREGRRIAQEKQEDKQLSRQRQLEDEAKLRNHLLEVVELERTEALEALQHNYALTQLKHQGVISLEQLKQRQEAYASESQLMRQMLEDSLANRSLKDEAERKETWEREHLQLRLRGYRERLEIQLQAEIAAANHEIEKKKTDYSQSLEDRVQQRKIEQARSLTEIQNERLKAMHALHMERERHDAELKLKLRELELKENELALKNRPKSDDEMKWSATPEQLRAAAEYEAAKRGHSIQHAAEKEAMLTMMIQSLQLAQSQTPAQIAAMLQQQEALWKSMFDRLKDQGDSGLQAFKEVALEISKNQKVNVQLPNYPLPTSDTSQAEIMEYLKALLMAQAKNTKN